MNFRILVFFVSLAVSAVGYSQPGFRGSAILGLNLAQLDGDIKAGYRKAGLTAGLKVAFDIKDKLEGNVELLFSQRGSSDRIFRDDITQTIKLNYVELPIYLSYRDWYIEKDQYYKMAGQLGFSVGGLTSARLININDISSEDFNNRDISFLIGATYSFTKHFGFTARYSRSFNKVLEDDILLSGYLLSYFCSLRAEYRF